MNQLPIEEKENKISTYNKKAVQLIVLLVFCGIVTGLLLSVVFINEANQRIEDMFLREWPFNENQYDFTALSFSDIFFPSIGVIIVCISTFLLLGLVFVYFKIFLKTNSKYVVGLLFFLTPLFIQSIFSVNTLRSLFVSAAIPYVHIRESIGFGPGGLGSVLVILSVFEIIGLSMLLYLSNE